MGRTLYFAVIFGLLFVQTGCMPGTEERVGEVLDSPDGKVQAVRVNREAGATVSDSVYVYIVPKGGKVTWADLPCIRLNRYKNVSMKWGNTRTLDVTYELANVIEVNRTWSSPRLDNSRYKVKLTLRRKQ